MRHGTAGWRRASSDALFLYLLPLLVSLLPWSLGFVLLKRLARSESVFADVVDAAWRQASRLLPALDREHFCQRHRLLLLVDRCDSLLCLLRSRGWWQARVQVQGDPLERLQPGLLLNSHWGSGNWIWRLLEARGLAAWFVARRAGAGDVGRGRLGRGYLAWRGWSLRRAGCRGVIYTGGSSSRVLEVLRGGDCVVGMLDLPVAPGRRGTEVRLLGRSVHFPVGLAALAQAAEVPSAIISCGLDWDSGRRRLFLEILPAGLSPDEIVRRNAAHLERRIETEPALWHAWPSAAAYFS